MAIHGDPPYSCYLNAANGNGVEIANLHKIKKVVVVTIFESNARKPIISILAALTNKTHEACQYKNNTTVETSTIQYNI